jgi:hypothetical protein
MRLVFRLLAVSTLPLLVARGVAAGEVVHLKNGDIVHGTVVTVGTKSITLRTPYGRLVIPKTDVDRIVYAEAEAAGGEQPLGAPKPLPPPAPPPRPEIALEIRGRSFWYAWQSNPREAADPRIRLRLAFGNLPVAELVDAKPDTVDRSSVYNSFTFSPSDSQVVSTAEGFSCSVDDAVDGRVVLKLQFPEKHPEGEQELQMRYQVNEGTAELPRWLDAVSRAFPVTIKSGKRTHLILEQDPIGLEFTGLMRKRMKNVESFSVRVLSSELREIPPAPPGH